MVMEIIVHPGVDNAFIAWRASFIGQCRGFALKRKVKPAPGSAVSPNTTSEPDARGFVEEIVASWVGFANGPDVAPGTRRPTTEWPIQKYLWSDFMVNPGDEVAYRVAPMVGPADALKEADDQASPWSPTVEIGAETEGRAACFFNRGIVASQWLARLLPEDHPSTKLTKVIATPGDKNSEFPCGTSSRQAGLPADVGQRSEGAHLCRFVRARRSGADSAAAGVPQAGAHCARQWQRQAEGRGRERRCAVGTRYVRCKGSYDGTAGARAQ